MIKTYGVKILYRIEAGEDIFYEEAVLRVYADSFDEAFTKAKQHAQGECMDEYVNPYGETVRQSVVNIMDCHEAFIEINDVHEIYSRIMSRRPDLTEEELSQELFDRADQAQMMALRVQAYNAPWTRREMRTLLFIFNHEPVSQKEIERHLGGCADREIGSLLRKELIEEIDQSDDHGRAVLYRTAERFEEEFAPEE